MLYGMLESLLNVGSWGLAQWGLFALGVGLVGGLVALKLTQLLRLILVLPVLVEAYWLTPSFACARSQMFTRAAGTQEACSSDQYWNYLYSNFGLNHWYMWVAYAGLAVFMLWPVLRGRYKTDKESMAQLDVADADAARALNRIDKIEHIGKI